MKLFGLPFQYTQRAADLVKASPEQAAAVTEQRDQDLENYLANLKAGGLTSASQFVATQFAGSGTLLAPSTPTAPDLVFAGTVGPLFDPSTGEWLGASDAVLLVFGSVTFTCSGLGLGVVSSGGVTHTSVTLVGTGATSANVWSIANMQVLDVATYEAIRTGGPSNFIGNVTYTSLSPGATYVDATLSEPATLTVNLDTFLPPTAVVVG